MHKIEVQLSNENFTRFEKIKKQLGLTDNNEVVLKVLEVAEWGLLVRQAIRPCSEVVGEISLPGVPKYKPIGVDLPVGPAPAAVISIPDDFPTLPVGGATTEIPDIEPGRSDAAPILPFKWKGKL